MSTTPRGPASRRLRAFVARRGAGIVLAAALVACQTAIEAHEGSERFLDLSRCEFPTMVFDLDDSASVRELTAHLQDAAGGRVFYGVTDQVAEGGEDEPGVEENPSVVLDHRPNLDTLGFGFRDRA